MARSLSLPWTLVLPGSLGNRTGGTIYDRRIVEEARRLGDDVRVVELPGEGYPRPDESARAAASELVGGLPTGTVVVFDGLALGALPDLAMEHARRLRLVALLHHPLCDERGPSGPAFGELLRAEARALRAVRGIIVTSSFTGSRVRELELAPEDASIEVVEPGVHGSPVAVDWKPGEPLRLLSIGSLTPRKAQLDAAGALAKLAREVPNPFAWTIVGRGDMDPNYGDEVRRSVSHQPIASRTRLLGEVTSAQLAREIQGSHLLLHPARYEGFGMVVTEALAAGLPVIASTGGALNRTLLEHGTHAGRLAGAQFAPEDREHLGRILAGVLGSHGRWSEWRGTALAARRKLQPWAGSAQLFQDALRRLIHRAD